MLKGEERLNPAFRIVLLTIAGCYLYGLSFGIRNNYGILLNPIIENSGISFTSASFVLALGQLVYGLVQPLFGILAAKKGNAFALTTGVVLITAGLLFLPFCRSFVSLAFGLGIVLSAGTGAVAYGLIMGAITPKLPPKSVSIVSGIVNASSGIGNTILSPTINSLVRSDGLAHGMFVLSIPSVLMAPIAIVLGKKRRDAAVTDAEVLQPAGLNAESPSIRLLCKNALKSRTYLFLVAGFFTCGFHMALITSHVPTQFLSYGFSARAAANAFSIYGITTIIGSIASGFLCGRMKLKNVLGLFYGLRPLTILLFFIVPKNLYAITAFTALLGLSGASTVPPVSGLIGRRFGVENLATLFGFALLVHQIGGFFGAWLGGICYNHTGSYTAIWIVDIALGFFASAISFSIRGTDRGASNE